MINRIYKLNGEETSLKDVLKFLEQELIYSGDTDRWQDLGINFEDIETKEIDETQTNETSKRKEELKQVYKDYLAIKKIIKDNKNNFEELAKIFNGYYKDEELFDFHYGDYGIFTYYKETGLSDTVEVWHDDGYWNSYIINKLKEIK